MRPPAARLGAVCLNLIETLAEGSSHGRRKDPPPGLALISTLAASAAIAGASTAPAAAEQGNMEAALAALQGALDSLHRATPNKGGHKERAAELVQQAMAEVQAGIDYAAEHGNG